MEKKRFEIEQYYEAPVCDCGGAICIRSGNSEYMSNPPQADFSCNKCGAVKRLRGPDYPGIKTKIIGIET